VPTQAYYLVEHVDDAKETARRFKHIDSLIEAYRNAT
jgi:hypothetical protein